MVGKIFSISGYIVLGLSALILILSPFIDFFKNNLPTTTLVGVFSGVVSYFIGFFAQKAEKIEAANTSISNSLKNLAEQQNQLSFMSLNSAISLAVGENKSVENIRIYASTTEVILPIIRDLKLKADDCKILLQIFDKDDPNPNSDELNCLCCRMKKKWEELKGKGIKNLSVVRYNRYPTEYLVIVDDRYLIRGRYLPNDGSEHGSDYFDPIVFSGKEIASKRYIDETIVWFDTIFNYFSKRQADIIK